MLIQILDALLSPGKDVVKGAILGILLFLYFFAWYAFYILLLNTLSYIFR